jgi:hypothetical protein
MRKKFFNIGVYALTALIVILIMTIFAQSQIQQLSGLAVATTPTKWSNVKDFGAGDTTTSGVLAVGQMLLDTSNNYFVRERGDAINGMWVNVKAGFLIISGGDKTPSDTYANPTDDIGMWSHTGVWDASPNNVWKRWQGEVKTTTSSTLATNQVTVTITTPVLIVAANTFRKSVTIRNMGTVDAYIGGGSVAPATGYYIRAYESMTVDRTTAAIYGITAAGSTVFCYMEE